MTEAPVKYMLNAIIYDGNEKFTADFLSLPRKLYPARLRTQDTEAEKALLRKTHVLSKYFSSKAVCVYDDGKVCARCMVFIYPDDKSAYIGFFECINDIPCAALLFKTAQEIAANAGCTKLTGPVDASFWLKYRMKTDRFEGRAYISEPYNREYYQALFEQCGFSVCERYVSNIYKRPDKSYRSEKYENRLAEFTEKGYSIVSPERNEWERVMGEVYVLVTRLYSDFPIYKHISREDFSELFKSFPAILDFSMVKIAYYRDEAVGFFIGMPDYKNRLCDKITPLTILYALIKKRFGKRYVMLYMGVLPEHRGLGKAITQTIIDNVRARRAAAVGAFIRCGKITEKYVGDMLGGQYHYILLSKPLNGEGGTQK